MIDINDRMWWMTSRERARVSVCILEMKAYLWWEGVKGLRTALLRQTAVGVVDLTDVCVCVNMLVLSKDQRKSS